MKLKHAIWASVIWTVVALGSSMLALWYVLTHPIYGVRAEDRANMLGQGAGMVMVFGYAAIWLPYAVRLGKRLRAAKEAKNDSERAPSNASSTSARHARAGGRDALRVKCPGCDKTLGVSPSKAGSTVKCPACGHGVRVPSAMRGK